MLALRIIYGVGIVAVFGWLSVKSLIDAARVKKEYLLRCCENGNTVRKRVEV